MPDSRDSRVTRPLVIYAAAAFLSLGASAWAVWNDRVINTDGALYVLAAEAIVAGDWSEAMSIYPWPFYSAVIGSVSCLSGVPAETSAHLVNATLYALLSVGFVALVRQLGGRGATLAAAAMIVLAAAPLNEQRSLVVRDGGAIAFQLLGIIALLRIHERATWSRCLCWGLSMTVATLFRPEAMIPLVLAPTVLLYVSVPACDGRWKRFLRTHVVLLAIATSIATLALCAPGSAAWESIRSSRLAEPLTLLAPLTRIVTRTLPNRATAVSRALFGEPEAGYGGFLVAIGLVSVIGVAVVQAMTAPHAVLTIYAFARRIFRPASPARRIWFTFVLLHLLLLIVVTLIHFGVTERSALFLALLLSVPAPFSLGALYERWRDGPRFSWKRDMLLVAVAIALSVTLVDGLVAFGSSKDHLRHAGLWVRSQTAEHATLFTNDTIVGHYARRRDPHPNGPVANRSYRPWEQVIETLRGDVWSDHDVVAIRLRRGQKNADVTLERLLGRPPSATFSNDRGDRVLVFRRDPEPESR